LPALKTKEITPQEFASKFGKESLKSGSFAYFVYDNQFGIIRDNIRKSIDVIGTHEVNSSDITPEEELALLALVCGEFKEEVEVPRSDTIFDYEEREKSTKRRLNRIGVVSILLIIVSLVLSAYLYFSLMN
jgi:hypothetical protein